MKKNYNQAAAMAQLYESGERVDFEIRKVLKKDDPSPEEVLNLLTPARQKIIKDNDWVVFKSEFGWATAINDHGTGCNCGTACAISIQDIRRA